MRSASIALICAGLVTSLLYANDDQHDDIVRLNEIDKVLYAFCQSAVLRDRGLACSPLAGTTDRWILEKLMTKKSFHEALASSKAPSWLSIASEDKRLTQLPDTSTKTASGVLAVYQAVTKQTSDIRSSLAPDQQEKLPGVYLRVEGPMALCRPDFAGMFENAETQNRIQALVYEAFSQKASPLHRTLFGLSNADEAPIYQAELRRLSADTDWQIVELLTEKERQRLWDVISDSRSLDPVTYGPPSF